MAKKSKIYECQSCGFQTPFKLGKCSSCNEWDSMVEISQFSKSETKTNNNIPKVSFSEVDTSKLTSSAVSIQDVEISDFLRFSTFDEELDIVLGGGVVLGSLVLIGGSPGVGKSTLLLKVAGNIAKGGKNALYISGEESLSQIKLRASRMAINEKNLYLYSETELQKVEDEILSRDYAFVVIDSIQTMFSSELTSAPGSVTQVRAITFELMRLAKDKNIAIFIIGHITKEGSIAGPRVLEHMVDVVLYFEGESTSEIRILRGFKNRFGTTSEIGVFEMTRDGLSSAVDIRSRFFTKSEAMSGSALTVIIEGTRPLIVEVQALVSETSSPNPRRVANGYETNRLNMLLALLEKKLNIPLNRYDVFINITGGIRISETASDLAILVAILSNYKDRPISKESIFIGEVSLVGDIREVINLEQRIKEAVVQNIKKVILPKKVSAKLFKDDKNLSFYEVSEVAKIIDLME